MVRFKTCASIFILFFCLSLTAQSPEKYLDSLHSLVKQTKNFNKKAYLYAEIAENLKHIDSLKYYIKKANDFNGKTNNDLVAKLLILKGRLYLKQNKSVDSFNYYVHKGLFMAKDQNVKSYGYKVLANNFLFSRVDTDSAYYYATKIIENTTKNSYKYSGYYIRSKVGLAVHKNIADVISDDVEALKYAKLTKDSIKISEAHITLGGNYISSRNYNLSMNQFNEALKFTKENSTSQAKVYTWLSYLISLYDNSDKNKFVYAQKALEINKENNEPNYIIAQDLIMLAALYLENNQNKIGIGLLKEIKDIITALKEDAFISSYYHRYYATYLLNNGDTLKAVKELKKSISLAKKTNNTFLLGEAWHQLGLIQYQESNLNEAFTSFTNSEKFAKNTFDPPIMPKIYINLKEVAKKKRQFKEALFYADTYNRIKDSLNKIENKISINEYLIRAKTLEKEKKILSLTKINQAKDLKFAKNKQFYILIFFGCVLIIIIVFGIILYKRKKKHLEISLALSREKEIMAEKNNLLENLSHEIRTPISIVNGYLHLIKHYNTYPKKVIVYADKAKHNSLIILNNFNNFLSLLEGNKKLHLEKNIDERKLLPFFDELLNSFVGNATEKDISIYYSTNFKDTLILNFDFYKLQKIVSNLLINALKYSDANKKIFVKTNIAENELFIEIKDEGIGIPEEEHELIFNRFYQSKNQKSSGGFGIGLSLVKELIVSLNGTISLKSKVNFGSTFKITLPVKQLDISFHLISFTPEFKEITSIEENKITGLVESKISEDNNLPNVLVIDDNLEMIRYLREILKTNYNCTFSNNGKDALHKIKEKNFDLIISDYKMPIMDGLTLKELINNNEADKAIPFLLLTAYSFNDFSKIKLNLGIQDYIAKPFTYNEIITRVRKLLENSIYLKKINKIESNVKIEGHFSDLLDNVKSLVLKNISNSNYKIENLASDNNYSQQQLGRIIKQNTGLTPVKLILEIRLQKAYELILNKKYSSLIEVVYAVGLNNRSYFNKKFLERFGIKPNDLKNK